MTVPQSPRVIASLISLPAWDALAEHAKKLQGTSLRQIFASDPRRSETFTTEAEGLYFDYSKNRIDEETIRLLRELAEQSGLREKIDAMFRGDKINITEGRSVLHVALRAPRIEHFFVMEWTLFPKSMQSSTGCRSSRTRSVAALGKATPDAASGTSLTLASAAQT